LRLFWEIHPQGSAARAPLQDWYAQAASADWRNRSDLKAHFGNASILKNGRVVFNIGGNRYRLVAKLNYAYRILYVRFIGTHGEYDAIDAETI
jgi:mRNA interferase HigB